MAVVERARRFPVATRVFWRPCGHPEWSQGVSLNASQSGVLFQSDRVVEIGTEVELIFGLSWDPGDNLDVADVKCLARVVRAEERGPGDSGSELAARIESYSFIRFMQQQ